MFVVKHSHMYKYAVFDDYDMYEGTFIRKEGTFIRKINLRLEKANYFVLKQVFLYKTRSIVFPGVSKLVRSHFLKGILFRKIFRDSP